MKSGSDRATKTQQAGAEGESDYYILGFFFHTECVLSSRVFAMRQQQPDARQEEEMGRLEC